MSKAVSETSHLANLCHVPFSIWGCSTLAMTAMLPKKCRRLLTRLL